MTRQEAVAWLDEHEADPTLPVDPDELREVTEAVTEEGVSQVDQPDLMRAVAIAQRAGLADTIGPAPVVDAEGNEVEQFLPDDQFTSRFLEAAEKAGVDREEAQTILRSTIDQTSQFGGSAEGLLLPLIADWEAQAEGLKGRPIGVPDDFVAQTFQDEPPASSGLERFRLAQGRPGTTRRPVEVDPRYFDGDQYSPAGMPPEEIIKIQKRLEKAGLLDSYVPGLWDSGTANAYTEVLASANRRGSTADDALDFMVSNPVEVPKEKFRAPAFVKPDYATLAQDVKSVMRTKLGREPSDAEMAELTGAMSSAYRADFDAQVAAMRSEFDAAPGETPAAVTDVDPVARFRETFESRFAPEIDRLAALPEVRENMTNVFSSLRTMGSLVG